MAALGVAGLAGILSHVSLIDTVRTFHNAKASSVLLFLLSSFMVMLVFTLRWMVITRSQGYSVPLHNLLLYRICGYGVGAITPTAKTGGEPVRIMLLKRHGISQKDRIFSVLTDRILETSTNFIFFLIGMLMILVGFTLPGRTAIFILALITIFAFLIVFFFTRMLKGKHFFASVFSVLRLKKIKRISKYENRIVEMEKIMISYYQDHKKNFFLAVLLSMFGWVFTFLELKFALEIVGIFNVGISQIFIILSVLGMAFLIPIPLALGSLEAFQISTFRIMNFQSAPAAVAMAFMIRVRDLIWTGIAVIALGYYGMKFGKIFRRSLHRVDEEVTRVKVGDGQIAVRRKKL